MDLLFWMPVATATVVYMVIGAGISGVLTPKGEHHSAAAVSVALFWPLVVFAVIAAAMVGLVVVCLIIAGVAIFVVGFVIVILVIIVFISAVIVAILAVVILALTVGAVCFIILSPLLVFPSLRKRIWNIVVKTAEVLSL